MHDVAAVPDVVEVSWKRLLQFGEEGGRMHGAASVSRRFRELGLPVAPELAQTIEPGELRPGLVQLVEQSPQRGPYISANSELQATIHAQLGRVDVHLDEFRLRPEQARAAQRQPVIDSLSQN